MRHASTARSGSAFFLILIAIALFAALTYAVMQGSRNNAALLTADQARVAATDILAYSNVLSTAVQQLRLAGCTDVEFSFDGFPVLTYTNASAPATSTCHILKPEGGKANYVPPITNWLDSSKSASALYGNWFAPKSTCIPLIGDTATTCTTASQTDLVIILPWLKKEVCAAINKALTGVETIPLEKDTAYDATTGFRGTYSTPTDINNTGDEMAGKSRLCFQGNTTSPTGGYHYYAVLLGR